MTKIPELEIIDAKASSYSEAYTAPLESLLLEILQFTEAQHPQAQMLSGHVQGKLLEMFSYMIRPKRILEIGTFTGFSALCLASGLAPEGRLHTIELREEDANTAQGYFNRSVYKDRIILHRGNALEVIPTLKEEWDLVFIDADKPGYKEYFNLVFPHLRKNGFILADNVLFHGQVLDDKPSGKNAKAIQEFNDYIKQQHGIDHVMLTVRDGLLLIRKL